MDIETLPNTSPVFVPNTAIPIDNSDVRQVSLPGNPYVLVVYERGISGDALPEAHLLKLSLVSAMRTKDTVPNAIGAIGLFCLESLDDHDRVIALRVISYAASYLITSPAHLLYVMEILSPKGKSDAK